MRFCPHCGKDLAQAPATGNQPHAPASQQPRPHQTKKSTHPVTMSLAIILVLGFMSCMGLVCIGSFAESGGERGEQARTVRDSRDTKRAELTAQQRLHRLHGAREAARHAAALDIAREIIQRHPDSPEAAEAKGLVEELEREVARERAEAEKQAAAAAEERRIRQLEAKWSYRQSTDDMTGQTALYAEIKSENTVSFDFPYQGAQRGTLQVRNHPSHGRSIIFVIERGQLICRVGGGRCVVRVRFGEAEPVRWAAAPSATGSSNVIFLRNYAGFLNRLQNTDVIRIQPEVFQEGAPVFEFQVAGFRMDKYQGR